MNTKKNGKYKPMAKRFWNNVSYLMDKKGITCEKMAEGLGISPSTFRSRKSTGDNLSIGYAVDMADLLDTTLDYLVYRDLTDNKVNA